ncbi:MAG: hypothetical protein WAW91_00245, partial [Candidatus Nanoperiomorbaceae bacterium]
MNEEELQDFDAQEEAEEADLVLPETPAKIVKSADRKTEKTDKLRSNLKPFTVNQRAEAKKLFAGKLKNSDYVHLHNHTNYS